VPGRRPTHEEQEEREELVFRLVALGKRMSFIKKQFREKFGPADHKTVQNYVTRVKQRFLVMAQESKLVQRAESKAFYEVMKANAKKDVDKLRAQERLDRLMALEIHMPLNPETLLELLGHRTTGPSPVHPGELPPQPIPEPDQESPDSVSGEAGGISEGQAGPDALEETG